MPVDPKTGKEYPYTEEGIKQHKEDTSFKMRGSPFQRNFGTKRPVLDRGGSLFKYKDEGHFLEKDRTGAPYEEGSSDCAECKGKPADCKCPE